MYYIFHATWESTQHFGNQEKLCSPTFTLLRIRLNFATICCRFQDSLTQFKQKITVVKISHQEAKQNGWYTLRKPTVINDKLIKLI